MELQLQSLKHLAHRLRSVLHVLQFGLALFSVKLLATYEFNGTFLLFHDLQGNGCFYTHLLFGLGRRFSKREEVSLPSEKKKTAFCFAKCGTF